MSSYSFDNSFENSNKRPRAEPEDAEAKSSRLTETERLKAELAEAQTRAHFLQSWLDKEDENSKNLTESLNVYRESCLKLEAENKALQEALAKKRSKEFEPVSKLLAEGAKQGRAQIVAELRRAFTRDARVDLIRAVKATFTDADRTNDELPCLLAAFPTIAPTFHLFNEQLKQSWESVVPEKLDTVVTEKLDTVAAPQDLLSASDVFKALVEKVGASESLEAFREYTSRDLANLLCAGVLRRSCCAKGHIELHFRCVMGRHLLRAAFLNAGRVESESCEKGSAPMPCHVCARKYDVKELREWPRAILDYKEPEPSVISRPSASSSSSSSSASSYSDERMKEPEEPAMPVYASSSSSSSSSSSASMPFDASLLLPEFLSQDPDDMPS